MGIVGLVRGAYVKAMRVASSRARGTKNAAPHTKLLTSCAKLMAAKDAEKQRGEVLLSKDEPSEP